MRFGSGSGGGGGAHGGGGAQSYTVIQCHWEKLDKLGQEGTKLLLFCVFLFLFLCYWNLVNLEKFENVDIFGIFMRLWKNGRPFVREMYGYRTTFVLFHPISSFYFFILFLISFDLSIVRLTLRWRYGYHLPWSQLTRDNIVNKKEKC